MHLYFFFDGFSSGSQPPPPPPPPISSYSGGGGGGGPETREFNRRMQSIIAELVAQADWMRQASDARRARLARRAGESVGLKQDTRGTESEQGQRIESSVSASVRPNDDDEVVILI